MHRAAAFPAASSVGVARSPRVGVPSIPRVVSGGWWVCAGVICTASDACFGGVGWGVRPWESWGVQWGWGSAGPPVVVCPSWVWVVAFAVVPFSSMSWSPLLPLPGSWVVCCPHVVSLPAPCPYECLPSLGAPSVPSGLSAPWCPLPSPCPCPPPSWCGGGGRGGVGRWRRRPRPGGRWPGATGRGLGGCRGGGGPGPHRGGGAPMPLVA